MPSVHDPGISKSTTAWYEILDREGVSDLLCVEGEEEGSVGRRAGVVDVTRHVRLWGMGC